MDDYLYICGSWQGLLQMIVYLIGRGYLYHRIFIYKKTKQDRWLTSDQKIREHYRCDLSKYQRAREKKKGKARFMMIRWQSCCVVMHTDGSVPTDLDLSQFQNVTARYVEISVSKEVAFWIYIDRQTQDATVRLTKESYKKIKDRIEHACRYKRLYAIRRLVEILNGFPAWRGVFLQKVALAKYATKKAGEHGKRLRYREIDLKSTRKVYKIWETKH